MAKWIAAEKARAGLLRHAVVCPNVTERTKERISQTKWAHAGSLAIDKQQVARTCISGGMSGCLSLALRLKKNLNVSKPPEHSPSGGVSKYLGGNIGCRDKLFMVLPQC